VQPPKGFVVFDDTVADKNFSQEIELVRHQYSGNAHRVIKGIGIVTCVYINPEVAQFWIIDYRIYDPDGDGKTKLDHVQEMLLNCVHQKQLPFWAVLMDSWYATKEIMLAIEKYEKIYYCPLKDNRLVDDRAGQQPHRRLDSLNWSASEQEQGKQVHVKDFPKDHHLKLFRLVLSTQRTEYVVTNDLSQNSVDAVQKVCAIRWRIEQFHRESKQLTGLEACQCRLGRIQRNHILCAMLVWVRLKQYAHTIEQTIYQAKYGLLSDYMIAQLKNPTIQMSLA
jgi:Transposase DDE domain